MEDEVFVVISLQHLAETWQWDQEDSPVRGLQSLLLVAWVLHASFLVIKGTSCLATPLTKTCQMKDVMKMSFSL